jgi:hypothetical protein
MRAPDRNSMPERDISMMDDGQGALFLAAGLVGGHVTSGYGKEGNRNEQWPEPGTSGRASQYAYRDVPQLSQPKQWPMHKRADDWQHNRGQRLPSNRHDFPDPDHR